MCYNWEYAREEILADNYFSVFNSHESTVSTEIIYR